MSDKKNSLPIWKIVLFIACVLIFIVSNSSQESYVGIDDITTSSLEIITRTEQETTYTTPPTETLPPPPPTPTGITSPTLTTGPDSLLPENLVPLFMAFMVILLILFLFVRRKKESENYSGLVRKSLIDTETKTKRAKFRKEIKSLVTVLYEYLEKNIYSEGIIYGFHNLDLNMRKILGRKRESNLTPKEFAESLDLPDIIIHLRKITEIFYRARYKQEDMTEQNLIEFIEEFKKMREKSQSSHEVHIIEYKEYKEEENNK